MSIDCKKKQESGDVVEEKNADPAGQDLRLSSQDRSDGLVGRPERIAAAR